MGKRLKGNITVVTIIISFHGEEELLNSDM